MSLPPGRFHGGCHSGEAPSVIGVYPQTRSPDAEDPFGGRVEVAPLDFSDPDGLRRSMQGSGRLLQHLLDTVRARKDNLRPLRGEHQERCSRQPRARALAG